MTNVPVKRGEAARQQPQVAVTDADREAGQTLIGTWLRDRNPQGLTDRVIEAIARARAEEREACASACLVKVSRPAGHRGQWEGYGGFEDDMTGPECAVAIRARGEGGK